MSASALLNVSSSVSARSLWRSCPLWPVLPPFSFQAAPVHIARISISSWTGRAALMPTITTHGWVRSWRRSGRPRVCPNGAAARAGLISWNPDSDPASTDSATRWARADTWGACRLSATFAILLVPRTVLSKPLLQLRQPVSVMGKRGVGPVWPRARLASGREDAADKGRARIKRSRTRNCPVLYAQTLYKDRKTPRRIDWPGSRSALNLSRSNFDTVTWKTLSNRWSSLHSMREYQTKLREMCATDLLFQWMCEVSSSHDVSLTFKTV